MYLLSYGGFCFRQDPSDLKTLAQLISAYSKFDPQKAQLYPFLTRVGGTE